MKDFLGHIKHDLTKGLGCFDPQNQPFLDICLSSLSPFIRTMVIKSETLSKFLIDAIEISTKPIGGVLAAATGAIATFVGSTVLVGTSEKVLNATADAMKQKFTWSRNILKTQTPPEGNSQAYPGLEEGDLPRLFGNAIEKPVA